MFFVRRNKGHVSLLCLRFSPIVLTTLPLAYDKTPLISKQDKPKPDAAERREIAADFEERGVPGFARHHPVRISPKTSQMPSPTSLVFPTSYFRGPDGSLPYCGRW